MAKLGAFASATTTVRMPSAAPAMTAGRTMTKPIFRQSPRLAKLSKYFDQSRNFRLANGLNRAVASKALNFF
jgi:hypothetical protein